MSTFETPRRPSPHPLPSSQSSKQSSKDGRSPPSSATNLRSRPSTLSFASLAPSDSRSNATRSLASPTSPTRSETTIGTARPPSARRTGKARGERSTKGGKPSGLTQIAAGTRLDDVDLLKVANADVLFQTFTVREVRELERRARAGAARKQEELRQMVGERYRDLLGAADSIVRMRTGSTSLLQKLEQIGHDCSKEEMGRTGCAAREKTLASSVASSSRIPYTLATLVKLLVDLPTHIWRALDASDFLLAARFETLGRVVYRELSSGKWDLPDTSSGGTVAASPVVSRHWEALGQLGPQIIRRGKAMLKRGDGSLDQVTQTLAAITLLDNLTAPDALALLLYERQAALDATITAAARQTDSQGVDARVQLIGSAVHLFMTTLEQAADIFGNEAASGGGTETSRLIGLLEALQCPPPAEFAPSAQDPPSKRRQSLVSAKRRYSLINSVPSVPANVPPLLSLLPNPQYTFRCLPESITAFSPFIDVNPTRNAIPLSDSGMPLPAHEWYLSGRKRLLQLLFPLISDVTTISQLAALRTSLRSTFGATGSSADQFRRELADHIDSDLERRFANLHENRLARLHASTLAALMDVLMNVEGPAQPDDFLFVDALPSLLAGSTAAAASGGEEAFGRFAEHLAARIEGRYPPAADVVRLMNSEARGLRDDLEQWAGSDRMDRFMPASRATCERLLSDLNALARGASNDQTLTSPQQVLVGNVANLLAANDALIRNVALGTDDVQLVDLLASGLRRLAADSLLQWKEETVREALRLFREGRGNAAGGGGVEEVALWRESEAGAVPAGPSNSAAAALSTLARSLASFGLNRLDFDRDIVRSLLSTVLEATAALETSSLKSSAHEVRKLVWDWSLLIELARANGCLSVNTEQKLRALQEEILQSASVPPSYLHVATSTTLAYLRRTQNLFGALLGPAHAVKGEVLMPLGQAEPAEYRSAAVTVKPGPRFVLLPVASAPRR